MVIFGILFHAIGGFAAGSFYIPLKKVKEWSWESGWLINGIFSWILAPIIVASITVPDLWSVLAASPPKTLALTYMFGILWGIGGLTFGLTMRYLGMALGYAMALGFCAAFGTLIPTIHDGSYVKLFTSASGGMTLLGILVCLAGIVVCGKAGRLKERALAKSGEPAGEFQWVKGFLVALFAGVMSACMAFAFTAGIPIAEQAQAAGAGPLWVNNAVLVVALAGGFTTNFIWCIILNIKNKTGKDYSNKKVPLAKNYLFAALAGVTWYLQFMFYGMGSTKMGEFHFASWTLHMAFIIIASNLWSLYLKEWKGFDRRVVGVMVAGILVVALSTVFIGVGTYLGSAGVGH